MLQRPQLLTPDELRRRLGPFCEKHRIRRLEVFGSVARGQASRNSDVDLLVTLDEPPASAAVPGGGPAQAGIRYFTVVVANVTTAAEQVREAGYELAQPLAEFPPVPGMGWLFVADPDGNWVELVGPI